jgi:TonB-linked SusC/RagA family outer membrane protein
MRKYGIPRFIILYLMCAGMGFSVRAADAQISGAGISIQMADAKLSDFFSEIEKKSDYVFMYKTNVNTSKRISINAENEGVAEILEKTLPSLQLKYHISGRQITIVRDEEAEQAKTLPNEALPAEQQNPGKTVAGRVTDSDGEPLIGVSIRVKGTTGGNVTDVNGNFTLGNLAEDAVLVFSYIGYASQEISVRGKTSLNVILAEDTQVIDEVVVVGYGTMRKSDLTGSIVSVSSEKFKNLPQGGVTQILQGKAAGVNITSTSGAGGTNIRIRGITSLNKSSEPLWVVDGVIGGTTGNFYDIQSIEVLKDASSTAIYGSQGANGVILVTTKRAQEGKAKVTLDARYGWSTMRKAPDLLSPYEYARALRDVNGQNVVSDADMAAYKAGTKGIDWIDLMTQTGFSQNYNLNVSGGSNKTKYGITFWTGEGRGQLVSVTSRNYNLKATLDTEITPWLSLSGYVYGSRSSSHNGSDQNAFTDIIVYSPCMELQREDGTYNLDPHSSKGDNPYGKKYAIYADEEGNSMKGFADLRFKIIDGLTLSLQGLYNNSHSVWREIKSSKRFPNATNEARNHSSQSYSWRNINNLTYQKEFGDHRLTAMGVMETTRYEWSKLRGEVNSFPNEDIVGYWGLNTASTQQAFAEYSNSGMISAFGRLVYSYKGKYSFTGTYRADAPSQFKDKYKWGYFPSVGLAWNVGEEDFINRDLIQQLKLRATVGSTGNHGVGAYSTFATLTHEYSAYGTDSQYGGYWPKVFSNPDVHWEKTTQYNLGLDLGVIDRRLNISTDVFLKKTTDLLFLKSLPDYNGGGAVWTNLGALDNKGWELTVNAFPVQTGDLNWESNFTASYTKTVVKDLGGEEHIIPDAQRGGANTGGLFAMVVGKPVGTFYLQEWVGFDENGANQFRTADGGVTTQNNLEDKKFIDKSSVPEWTFGWNNSLTWKNWDFNVFFRATGEFYRLNHSRFYESCMTGASQFISSREAYYLSWDHVADKSKAQFPSLTNTNNQYVPGSTQWLENAQFLRCQNMTLGYLFPKKQTKIADIHLSLSVENLFVLTGYKGMDPETVSETDYREDDIPRYDLTFGLDDGSFPIPRSYSFILRFDF